MVGGIGDELAGGRRRNGDRVVVVESLGSIPWTEMERTTRRIFPCPQNGGGWSVVAVPWRYGGGAISS
jgi:hypothetical protein